MQPRNVEKLSLTPSSARRWNTGQAARRRRPDNLAVATDDCQPRLVETTFSAKSPLKIDLVSSFEAKVDRTTKLMVSALLQQVSSVN